MDAPSPAPEPQPERGSVPLWTPKQVAYLSILTGFPTGLVLSSINWSRMGSAWTAAVYWIVGLIFLTLWTFIADGLLLAGINIAFSFVLYQQMKHDVGQFHREGYEITSRTWKSGCLVGVITVVVTVFLFVFILWLASAAS
jgi:hypothetical protein